jgi:hypothetical protein
MLCKRACFQGTVERDASKDQMTAVVAVRQALGQTGMKLQRHMGKLRGHAMDRRPERTAGPK